MAYRLIINQEIAGIEEFARRLPQVFAAEGVSIYRGRNELKEFVLGSDRVVVKRFGHLSWPRKVIYTLFCKTKARRSYINGMRFLKLGFDTPEPYAVVDVYKHGLLSDSYFVCAYCEGDAAFNRLVSPKRFDTELADEVAQLMSSMHAAGAIHGDPNLNNVICTVDSQGNRRLSLIDTNRSYFKKHLSHRERMSNLMRVTHRRDLMREIAGRYAHLSGYDPIKTIDEIFARLHRFERNRRLRHRLKALFSGRR